MNPKDIQPENIVASGAIGTNVSEGSITEAFSDKTEWTIKGSSLPSGASIRHQETCGTVNIFFSGKFTVTGIKSKEALQDLIAELERDLSARSAGIIKLEYQIVNKVYSLDLGDSIPLKALLALLPEEAEFEPEISPFLVFRPEGLDCVMTISASGKSVANTNKERQEVLRAANRVTSILETFHD